jgi:hypothetical protein
MAQLFPKWSNKLPIYILMGLVLLIGSLTFSIWYWGSPEFTDVGYSPKQPIKYSHKFHAGELGLDCRYCHTKVEFSANAGVPPTQTCMNCHAAVKKDSLTLELVQLSWDIQRPIEWVRVYKSPDYVYFDHSIHVNNGIGCSSCHGDVKEMETVFQAKSLSMGWCLECHNNPENYIRPLDMITDTKWIAPQNQVEFGLQQIKEKNITPPTECTGCHR